MHTFTEALASLDESFMSDTCAIVHPGTPTQDTDGGWTPGTTTTTDIPCRVTPSGGSPAETLIASRLTDVTPFTFSVPIDTVVSERDTISFAGGTYQILGVLNPASWQTSLRVVTKRIT